VEDSIFEEALRKIRCFIPFPFKFLSFPVLFELKTKVKEKSRVAKLM
jgi:hypothetical protein